MDVRLIIDRPAAGAWNMAVDEALLHSVGRAGQGGCLRFYFWEEATLSLGYFQRHADRLLHPPSCDCPLVRRSTGGGAIVHASELTYSFAMPLTNHVDGRFSMLYFAFHETLIDELASRGIRAALCHDPQRRAASEEPFLCFLRRAEADLLLDGHKVAGSAQRRRRQGLMQHGSILLKTTRRSPELAGIEDLSGQQIDPHDLAKRWAVRLIDRLNMTMRESELSEEEVEQAQRWCRERFSNPNWMRRK